MGVRESCDRVIFLRSGSHRFVGRPARLGPGHGVRGLRGQRVERTDLSVRHRTVSDTRTARYVQETVRSDQRRLFYRYRPVHVRVRYYRGRLANRRNVRRRAVRRRCPARELIGL